MEQPHRLTKLPNGVRIASIEMPHMRSVSVGFWVGIGGRHEARRECGISHFVEHLLFKGTNRRNAKKITEDVEGIGGYINAFTTEDHTCYYARAAAQHLPDICDVLADMFLESQFPPSEIERERDVIREEILSYRDHPEQHASELLTETMWPRHPLGRPLTGDLDTLSTFRRPQLLNYLRENYNGRTTVIAVAGPVSHEHVLELLRESFSSMPGGRTPRFERARPLNGRATVALFTQETEQTHVAMGFHAFGRRDERRFALRLLSVVLGENMSSRLFQSLRERHGCCYSVQSSVVTLDDTGCIHISAGIEPAKLEKSVRMILREIERICQKAPSRKELKKAQDYTLGQTFMGLESTTSQMMWMGESLLGYGHILDPAEIEKKVCAVAAEDIQRVACHCLHKGRMALAVVGPIKDAAQVEGWLRP